MLPSSLLIKPVSARCNLACQYCFYAKKSKLYTDHKVMGERVLEEMISQYLGISTERASFSWQGGEPLLAGLDFYKCAIEFEKRHGRGQVVSNAFQTNGTLLSEDWAGFFRRYKFLVGISLDGPADLHDIYRRTAGGRPTFDMVMRGVEFLREGGVDFNALTVVHDKNVTHPDEIYDFFAREGIKFLQFVPCLERDEATGAPATFNVDAQKYGEFLCRIFDLWKRDFPEVYVRLFNSILAMRMGEEHGLCTLGPMCGEYVLVEHNGDVYPCDFFVERERLLGNIMENPLRRIVEGTALMEFARSKSKLPSECKECPWLDLCFGGCQYHRIGSGSPDRTYFCLSYRRFFEYSEKGFEELESRL